ncbi:1-acyl-sn-glycerol-3-phosphate acyltransferase [bacterium A37T11]|nr:1-acyl-sn-glycerol-3-phosphate acyltransferase [bacterium A37T11]
MIAMGQLLKKLHRIFYFAAVLFCFIPLYPFLWLASKNVERHFSFIVWCRHLVGFLSSWLAGFFYRYEFEEPIDWSRNYVIVANHTSNLDTTALVLLVKNDFSFMGKHELLNNLVTGMFFRTIDIPVNRSSKISAFKAFKRADNLLREGKSVVIFPEGRITDTYPPLLQDFKNGAFKLAIELDIPILPVVIQDAWRLFWDDGQPLGSRPGICHINVLKPINTHELHDADADALKDKVHQLFADHWVVQAPVTNLLTGRL